MIEPMSDPRVSILTAVYDPPREAFEDTVASVLKQSFTDWEWVLADDSSTAAWVLPRLRELAAADSRVRVVERASNGGIVAASASALQAARGVFVALLDHDDTLTPYALRLSMNAIDADPVDPAEQGIEVDFVYSDQDKMTAAGKLHSPYQKPDWSPERLRHHMYTSHFAVLRRSLVEEVGGFRPGYDGSQDHDLVLRVSERARAVRHVPRVLYHWRQVEGSAAAAQDAKPYAWDAGVRAVQDHLDRVGINATAKRGTHPGLYRVERQPDLTTPVSIIIPTIGSSGLVWGARRAMVVETVRSVALLSKHTDIEFVVVYDTPTPAKVLTGLESLREELGIDLKLIHFREPFNFSAKCNVGALHSRGEVLVFLNDDMEAKSSGLVESLIAPLSEDGVGATGPKLFFEDGRIQHAGLTYGSGQIYHAYYRALPDTVGSHGDLWINREVSALTGACIAIRRENFEAVGGFTERLPLNFNDVDFCLKVRREGLRLVWLHDVELYHFESVSRSTDVRPFEIDEIVQRWGPYIGPRERYSNVG